MTRKKPEAEPTPDPVHPLLKNASALQKLAEKVKGSHEQEEVLIEAIEDWKLCLNRLARIPDAQHFFKHLIKHAGIFKPVSNINNTVKLVEDAGKRDFYLKYVRPYLDPAIRRELE